MKPVEYPLAYTVTKETKYFCTEPESKGTLPKIGILNPGRVVWLNHAPKVDEDHMKAFAQGIGMIEVDGRLLHRA